MAKANRTTDSNKPKGKSKEDGATSVKTELIQPLLIDDTIKENGGKKMGTEKEIELENLSPLSEKKSVALDKANKDPLRNNSEIASEIAFNSNAPIYLEIHRRNIFHYFSSGIITPSKYISNRAFPDIQTINQHTLIVSNGRSLSNNGDSILIELLLTESEKRTILVQSNLGYIQEPVPISKIKRIYVPNEPIKQEIISDALVHDGGYIPSTLIVSGYPRDIKGINFVDFNSGNLERYSDYTKQLSRFDKTLGLLAFLRNYNLLLSKKNRFLQNHTEPFFFMQYSPSIIALVNKLRAAPIFLNFTLIY